MTDVELVWDGRADLGEGPLWAPSEAALYWVDIVNSNVHRLTLDSGVVDSRTFTTQVTSLAQREQGGLIGTTRDGFAFVDFESGVLDHIVDVEANLEAHRCNDGKVDLMGRYWVGTMDDADGGGRGALYRLDLDHQLRRIDDDYVITNGPAFNWDGDTMLMTDSVRHTIYRFDIDGIGDVAGKRVFVEFDQPGDGAPDGMTFDSEGCVWVCHFGGSRVTRFSPEGDRLETIELPVPNVTSCTFAGPDLDEMYITTARIAMSDSELDAHPEAGSLFRCRPGVTGLPTQRFLG